MFQVIILSFWGCVSWLDGSSGKLGSAADDSSTKLGSGTDYSPVELGDTTEDYLGRSGVD